MKDLDEAALKRLAREGHSFILKGVDHVLVPRDLLERVTKEFDCDHVRTELRGPRIR